MRASKSLTEGCWHEEEAGRIDCHKRRMLCASEWGESGGTQAGTDGNMRGRKDDGSRNGPDL